ncbi:MAG: hypothetical protein ABIH71_00930 [Candidatus Omnitrophota bacterium]|nr:hypothetical protein [Candidatus Omnitrophota bacterium]
MEVVKSSSLRKIEERMENMDKNSVRYHVLQKAKDFKSSWIELGRALYSVYNDKTYKEWGYQAFETYTVKEVGVKKQTAMRLLNSYYFLEKEEPICLQRSCDESSEAKSVPSYEAVDVLRLAKRNKELDESDYDDLKKGAFEDGRDAKQLKKDVTLLLKKRKDIDPEEERIRNNKVIIKRCVATLKTIKKDIEVLGVLPQDIAIEIGKLLQKIEAQIL